MSCISSLVNTIAQKARARVLSLFAATGTSTGDSALLVVGARLLTRFRTDIDQPFRQESNFTYLTGVQSPDFVGVILGKDASFHLFMPKLPQSFAMWHGVIESLEDVNAKHGATETHFVDDLESFLTASNVSKVFTFPPFEELDTPVSSALAKFSVDHAVLPKLLIEARLHKFPEEISVMKIVNDISSDAHEDLMRFVKPGQNERQLHGRFKYLTHSAGAPIEAYGSIVAAGKNGSILHYMANNDTIKEGQMMLIDAGAELNCYASDITRCYPSDGKFTEDQREVYDIVLQAQKSCIQMLRPGIEWVDVHRNAERVIAEGLLKYGFVQGSLEDILKHHIQAIFFPHGIGHFLGLDTHDVGGYPEGVARIDEPSIRYLRVNRKLEAGYVVTVEPGVYFIDYVLEESISNPEVARFLNVEKVQRFRSFGGVRIEDDVLITESGYENLTKTVKEFADVELMCSGSNI